MDKDLYSLCICAAPQNKSLPFSYCHNRHEIARIPVYATRKQLFFVCELIQFCLEVYMGSIDYYICVKFAGGEPGSCEVPGKIAPSHHHLGSIDVWSREISHSVTIRYGIQSSILLDSVIAVQCTDNTSKLSTTYTDITIGVCECLS